MDSLCDEILVKIFKHFDLKTRVEVAKTCKRWRRLIFDQEAAFDDDISEVRLGVWQSDEYSSVDAKAVLALLDRRVRLDFSPPFVENEILADPEMRVCFSRFEKFVLLDDDYNYENGPRSSYWSQLPTSTKHVSIDESGRAQLNLNVFSGESMQLESLDLTLYQLRMSNWDDDDPHDDDPLPTIVLPSGLKSFKLTCSCSIRYLLQYVQLTPTLLELDLKGMEFAVTQFLQLLRFIRDALPNLERLRLSECEFVYLDEVDEYRYAATIEDLRNEQFLVPIMRIELDRFRGNDLHFRFAVEALLEFSTVESISITANQFVKEIYDLTPVFVRKPMTLELSISIGSIYAGSRIEVDEIPVPTELARIVTMFELVNVQCPKVFRPMFVDVSFDLLTEMRLERCRDLGDAELAVVAEWCKDLENLYFEPDNRGIFDILTDQCLLPFLAYWDDRRSKNLVIECLKPAAPFGGFNLPADGETGSFTDDKRWARYRKTFPADGLWSVYKKTETISLQRENGTRLSIWDSKGKSLVITDYKRNVERSFEVDLTDGGCRIAETRGPLRQPLRWKPAGPFH